MKKGFPFPNRLFQKHAIKYHRLPSKIFLNYQPTCSSLPTIPKHGTDTVYLPLTVRKLPLPTTKTTLLFTPRPVTHAQKPQNSGFAQVALGFVTQKTRENASRWRGCEKQQNNKTEFGLKGGNRHSYPSARLTALYPSNPLCAQKIPKYPAGIFNFFHEYPLSWDKRLCRIFSKIP